jgi:outer membrane protein OmpA-like peptidoglycan-associated protein
MRIGQLLATDDNRKDQANAYFERAVALDSNETAFLKIYEILGISYLQKGHYQQAEKYLRGYVRLSPNRQSQAHRSVERYLRQCRFAQQQPSLLGNFTHQALPEPLNKALSQTYPVLTADLQTLIFTKNNGDEDLVVSEKQPQGWTPPKSLSDKINTNFSEGTCTISADGRTLIFTACHRKTNFGKCDLYLSRKVGRAWSAPVNLGPTINASTWQSQPSLSADGTRLYFSSDRVGGVGGKDIWMTTSHTGDVWSNPVNLGPTINTEFDEISPFIHANGVTLFFASDGWPSVGGFDMFVSKNTQQIWSNPQNLGFPLNDFADQMGFFITPDCQQAFYSYHKRGSYSESHSLISALCQFPLSDTLKQLCPPMQYVKGRILDAHSRQPLGASIRLNASKAGHQPFVYQSDDSTGVFLFVMPQAQAAQIEIQRAGYLTRQIGLAQWPIATLQNGEWEVSLLPLTNTSSIILGSTFFEKGSTNLSSNQSQSLEQLAEYLRQNLHVKLLIEGHTDDVGTAEFNHRLSVQRAEAVKNYLFQKGIEKERLTTKGYGKTQPLTSENSETARQKNRRVECKLIP